MHLPSLGIRQQIRDSWITLIRSRISSIFKGYQTKKDLYI
jgi:hypothetical protein